MLALSYTAPGTALSLPFQDKCTPHTNAFAIKFLRLLLLFLSHTKIKLHTHLNRCTWWRADHICRCICLVTRRQAVMQASGFTSTGRKVRGATRVGGNPIWHDHSGLKSCELGVVFSPAKFSVQSIAFGMAGSTSEIPIYRYTQQLCYSHCYCDILVFTSCNECDVVGHPGPYDQTWRITKWDHHSAASRQPKAWYNPQLWWYLSHSQHSWQWHVHVMTDCHNT